MKSIVGPLIKLVIFGVVTVVTTSLLAVTIANAGGDGDAKFNAVFTDATLLNPGDDVRIAGVRVGQVESVEVYDRNKAKVAFNRKTGTATSLILKPIPTKRMISGIPYPM